MGLGNPGASGGGGTDDPLTPTDGTQNIVGKLSVRASGGAAGSEQFGEAATATGTDAVALGETAAASATGAIAIGSDATAAGTGSIVIGDGALTHASASNTVVIGAGSTANNASTTSGVIIGASITSGGGTRSVVIGAAANANTGATDVTSIGYGNSITHANADYSTSIGGSIINQGGSSVAIGYTANIVAGYDQSIVIGRGVTATHANDGRWGSSTYPADHKSFRRWAVKRTATAVSANTAATVIVGVTSTASARTITLDTDDVIDGLIIIVKDESGAANVNNITIDTEGTELIDGAASIVINTAYGVARLYSNGTNWFTF